MEFVEFVDHFQVNDSMCKKLKPWTFCTQYTKWSSGDKVSYWEDKIKNAGLTLQSHIYIEHLSKLIFGVLNGMVFKCRYTKPKKHFLRVVNTVEFRFSDSQAPVDLICDNCNLLYLLNEFLISFSIVNLH